MAVVNISGVSDSRAAAAAGQIIKENNGQWLIITPSFTGAARMAADLSFFIKKKIFLLQTEGDTFVTYEAKNKDAVWQRLKTIRALCQGEECVVITPATAAIKKMPPLEVFKKAVVKFQIGEEANLEKIMTTFVDMGYERVPMVYAPGQFSMRGGILDVFTPYESLPYRIEFFDTEVDSIRIFDVESQRSVSKINKLEVFPAGLLIRDEKGFKRAIKKVEKNYKNMPERMGQLIDSIETMTSKQHLENYMDYFYKEPENILDYMNEPGVIIDDPNRAWESLDAANKELKIDFEAYLEQGKLAGEDFKNFPSTKELGDIYSSQNIWFMTPFSRAIKGVSKFDEIHNVESRQTLSYNGKMDLLEKELERYVGNGYKITIVCSTEERLKNMKDFLTHFNFRQNIITKLGNLTAGMDFPKEKICLITDGDIFGTYKRKKEKSSTKNAKPIKSFAEISTGDFVVHENHGVGKFTGLKQLTVAGETKDYLKVKYAGNDMLYVPVEQMELIQKYIGADAGNPRVNKLAGSEWRTTKSKAKVAVANMAKELLEISAAREANPGHAFGKDTVWQKEFEDSFPYEETPDQIKCIEEIKMDMEKPEAMDRLLCGDVGYGKTEVAARAMFKCTTEGKQVAVLVPTTILASQHYHTLKERFEKFPFTVDMLCRFRSDKEQKETIRNLEKGTVDVVIGTHRLLSKDVKFKDLGLLIIDEEQRFGVQHKESIKQLRQNVDVLTLSATPIPRTLHMSLVGMRDMSLIEEPPEERYPVQTYVMEEDDMVIREAIERELDRGGQVYIIYNRVNGVHRIADKIDKLVPGRRIVVGHGRMSEGALEDVMMSFMEGEADILIATTIIESGIDIPNVNTEIIIDADKFGLSQLYQLRGRVGRSNRLAYAYMMHRPDKVLTQVAEKRLRAIRDFTEFGAGFKIAMRDLEIRGAGNLLGTEQHGHIVNIGYELYCKMVDDAVRVLKGESIKADKEEAIIDMKISALISQKYISDEKIKLGMYKKIATVEDEEDEKEIMEELVDRFGEVPAETKNLIYIARIKSMAESLGFVKVSVQRDKVAFSYSKKIGTKPVVLFLKKPNNPLPELISLLKIMHKNQN